MDNSQAIKAYSEVYQVLKRYSEVFKDDYDIRKIKDVLQRLEIEERFGIPLEENGPLHYRVKNSYDNWANVACFFEGRSISWPDDGNRLEKDEWLYQICFPAGAYIFGDHYPKETFDAFFEELKSFGAKYSDTANNCLYFSEENSKVVYESFWNIFKKYKVLASEEFKRNRKKELEMELEKLNKE
jgi:hypothetical protein